MGKRRIIRGGRQSRRRSGEGQWRNRVQIVEAVQVAGLSINDVRHRGRIGLGQIEEKLIGGPGPQGIHPVPGQGKAHPLVHGADPAHLIKQRGPGLAKGMDQLTARTDAVHGVVDSSAQHGLETPGHDLHARVGPKGPDHAFHNPQSALPSAGHSGRPGRGRRNHARSGKQGVAQRAQAQPHALAPIRQAVVSQVQGRGSCGGRSRRSGQQRRVNAMNSLHIFSPYSGVT